MIDLFIASALLFFAGMIGFLSAPYVPTRKYDILRFLALAEMKKGEKFYDLGCGDGRIPDAAAKQGAEAVGLEFSILNYLFCKLFRPCVKTRFQNFFKADFSGADLVYMFLSARAHNKMGEILRRQMKKGSRIITYVWPIEGLEAIKIDKVPGRPNLFLYLN